MRVKELGQLLPARKSNFDAAFLERRMRQHREWQARAACGLAEEIVLEVTAAIHQVQQIQTATASETCETQRLK